ncbi:MAG: hypothetical protein J6Z11_13690 [Candidatus Riflebacteria bacterium]|nr:hypothetical protein [Candidatus Riflebacteria bacterium]
MIGKHLKDYKAKYLAARRAEHPKSRIKKNSDWKKRWMPFIKYDHDFDGGFFLELIVHKLHIMLDYYDHGKYCSQVDESRLEIVESLKKACRLGDLLMADEFDFPAYEVSQAHCKHYTTPCADGCHRLHIEWDSPENKKEYDRLIKEGDELRDKTEKEFFNYIRDNYHKWWD